MLAFIDAAVIAYTRYDAPQRPACTEIMSWVAEGRLPATTSVLVIEEVWPSNIGAARRCLRVRSGWRPNCFLSCSA